MSINTAWVALSLLPHVGTKTLSTLMATFGNAYNVLAADKDDLMQVRGVGKKIAESIQSVNLAQVESDIEDWQNAGLEIILPDSSTYPQNLASIPDAPAILFMRGKLEQPDWQRSVAIVGTRSPSQRATKLAKDLAQILAEDKWMIVSGLALGIDSMAHEGALRVEQGRTIAVLGSGVLNIYPPENEALATRILENGLILSENQPYATAKAPRLVSRNRIISGLSQHIIVVETSKEGGAMHAARAAIQQGCNLHTFDLRLSGNQDLLRNGVHCLSTDLSQLQFN